MASRARQQRRDGAINPRNARISALRAARRRQPRLDALEDRTLLAVTSSFMAGLLTVASDADDGIAVTLEGDNVQVNGMDPGTGPAAAADVTMMEINGGPLANIIDLSAVTAAGFPGLVSTTIAGGAGSDTILGTQIGDTIDGGAGDDSIFGLDGDDTIQGGLGRDNIVGGRGADTIFGFSDASTTAVLVGLGAPNTLVMFPEADPSTILSTTPVDGVVGTLIGLDTRPATGELYGLDSFGILYTINPETGEAIFSSSVVEVLDGTAFGVDFNPVPDRLRIVSDNEQDLRVNVETGATIIDGTLAYAPGDLFEGSDPNIVGAGYLNAFAGSTSTTLYDIDSDLDILVRQNPPNDGTLQTIGDLGFDVDDVVGFDIVPGTNTALATFNVAGVAGLYEVDLETGAATLIGPVDDGTTPIGGLTALTDDDVFVWNNGDGSDIVDGGPGSNIQVVNGSVNADTFEIAANGDRIAFARTSPGPFTLDIGSVAVLTVSGRLGDDVFNAGDLSTVPNLRAVNLLGGDGDDRFVLAEGASLLQGTVDGGLGNDTIDYSAFMTPVTVDLGAGRQVFTAMLSGDQEVPPTPVPGTGMGTFVLNMDMTELAFNVSYSDLQAAITGAHFHASAPSGENAPIVRGLTAEELNGSTTPDGTFDGVWTSTDPVGSPTPTSGPLTPELVQAIRDGLAYFNIHTTEFPAGEIRGQIVPIGSEGTGPGVGTLSGIDTVIGGSGDDTISGGLTAETLIGGSGDDTINGGAGDDTIVWNNGDGNDIVDGGLGVDTQLVNGSTDADTFSIAANGTRLDFQRTSPGPFTLDIGTVETLEVNAGLGQDTITVGDLTGVSDLTTLDLNGGPENDAIDASALPSGVVQAILRGGSGNDDIIGSLGDDLIFGGQGDDTIVGNRGDDTIIAGITPETALFAGLTTENSVNIFTADNTSNVMTVPLTGLEAGENAVGVDFRASETDDVLYVVTDQSRIYTATPDGALTLLSTLSVPLEGTSFGVDFNPVADRLRIVSDTGQDLRVNVETGATIEDGRLVSSDIRPPEDPIPAPRIVAAAYTNSYPGTTSTTLYDIDALRDTLVRQDPPNDGILSTIGALGFDVTDVVGFDILPGSDETAYAALVVGGVTGLYTVDLMTGAATFVGDIADGTTGVPGLAVAPDNDTIIWNNGDGSDIIDGGAGYDTQIVNGSTNDDIFNVSAGADGRLSFARISPGPFTLDIGTVEVLQVNAGDGDDTLTVDDLTGVDALERIVASGNDGDDTVDASALGVAIPVIANGGMGNDLLIGGPGDDILDGGPGNNRVIGNAGNNQVSNARANPSDFDGDGISDPAVYTVNQAGGFGAFEVTLSTTGQTVVQRLGGTGSFPVAGDYDGDGVTDFAIYGFSQDDGFSSFTFIRSSDGVTDSFAFGGPNDFPVAGDYDGDGTTDFAVYGFSPANGFSRFAILPSGGGDAITMPFGGPNDFPVAGDYDGDGLTDIAVYGFSEANGFSRFGIIPSGGSATRTIPFGGVDDSPVAGDYDGDGVTDVAVFGFSPANDFSRFAVLPSGGGDPITQPFGGMQDTSVAADYDGDGTTDFAVFGTGAGDIGARFAVLPSAGGMSFTVAAGSPGSVALPPSSGLFPIQPLPDSAGGSATAAQRAGRRWADLVDSVLDDLADESTGRDRPLG